MIRYSAPDDACIPAGGLPRLAIDYAVSRGALPRDLVRGTGIPGDGLPRAGSLLSPAQYLQLLANVTRQLASPETSFMLGQHALPGPDEALATALRSAGSLRHALELLCLWAGQLSPLLRPRLHESGGQGVLLWSDSYGAPALRPQLVEMQMTAVVSLARWLGGQRLPWTFCFNRARPRHAEQHEVHLGPDLRFDCQLDAMLLDAARLDQPWPAAGSPVSGAALLRAGLAGLPLPSLLDCLYDYLLAEVRNHPTLESASLAFGVSPATLKRHLARCGTHFLAELDMVRTHVALHLFQSQGADNQAVARYLGFHDAANFRRSFKRWTGLTPALLRAALGA